MHAATAPSLAASQRSAARIVWRAPGSPVGLSPFARSRKNEGARNAGVTLDPRASASRDTEAARSRAGRVGLSARATGLSPAAPQVRRFSGVPRAVFIGLLRMTPGGLTFQGFSRLVRSERNPTHRFGS
jgi:hypothetical protein